MVPPPNAPEAVPAGLDIPPADWQQTPPSVQTLVVTLLQRLEAVEARLKQDSTTSQRPPSTDSPYKKARQASGDAPTAQSGWATRPSWPSAGALGPNRDTGSSPRNNVRVAIPPWRGRVPTIRIKSLSCLPSRWT